MEAAIKRLPEEMIVPLLSPNGRKCDPTDIFLSGVSCIDFLYDFQLIWREKSFGVIRNVASGLSKTILKTTSSSLVVPDLAGPFEMIIDFLRLKEILVTPETEIFLFLMSSFLDIPSIFEPLEEGCAKPCISNLPLYYEVVVPGTFYFVLVCDFIAANLTELLECDALQDVPVPFAERVLKLCSEKLENHDVLIQLIMSLKLRNVGELGGLLTFVEPAKVSRHTLVSLISNPVVDLDFLLIRRFLGRIFGWNDCFPSSGE
jgi:hypothetical protein